MSTQQFAHTIRLTDSAGDICPATLNCEARYWNEGGFSRRTCTIKLHSDRCELERTDRDFFEAFCRVREALELEGLTPTCYGASRNVFPSGMGRDMSDGLKAYKMRLGQQATELVDIFAEGSDVEPVSVAKQNEFWRAWLQSLGHPPVA